MNYLVLSEDLIYIEALEKYYKKHYKSELELLFNDSDVTDYPIICSKKYAKENNVEYCLCLSNQNQIVTKEINQYQSGRSFMNFLLSLREEDFDDKTLFQTFAFINGISTAGCTTLSLNLANKLSMKGKTIWFSLEEPPSTMYYIDNISGLSMMDIIFYLKQDKEVLINRIKQWSENNNHLHIVDQAEFYRDLSLINTDFINHLLEILQEAGFSYVVIDFGRKEALFKVVSMYKKIMIIKQDLNHYYRLSGVLDTLKLQSNMVYLINQRRSNKYLNEAYLRILPEFSYIDFDNQLSLGERLWKSEMIVGQLTKNLKL